MATTTRASLMHNGAGCDGGVIETTTSDGRPGSLAVECDWVPLYKAGTLAQVRIAARQHARRFKHATFVLVESCTSYDERSRTDGN